MLKYLCVILCLVGATNHVHSAQSPSRIESLLPGLIVPFRIIPAIPDDFVAMGRSGDPSLYSWTYWGPKDVLEAYFKDENSLTQPIIAVKLSSGTCQTGPKTFSGRAEVEEMMKENPKNFLKELSWGNYPVNDKAIEISGHQVRMAHVGLNDPEGRWVLMFNLIYPGKHLNKAPQEKDLLFWDNFIANTKGF